MNYTEATQNISKQLNKFRKEQNPVFGGFSAMARGCSQDGALSAKTKEFIATAVAIANRCEGCIGFHVKALINMGTSYAEFKEVCEVAMYMGGGPSVMTVAEAMQAWEEFDGPQT
ncbi:MULTISPECIES: carboxymuconolactone decarboxylase family protein [unclassified Thalassotalea]|uniref:carboxymuconolactone decarboxylase family protein n=1 Tax=unclassified Thalassotalea TaxID=2614972 RepID=UPI001080A070|nr:MULTISPECIES: carboxymuconolactone decarboxylase family protein [unclassified Thalassotalea]NMP16627.1 carboxymuconolactone decarboxylase family protein [Thalassotalea sp. Y01]QBY03030.1 carboxymuconolactone decarboxylase family protein [Thalassotalea sp. HSM 43]